MLSSCSSARVLLAAQVARHAARTTVRTYYATSGSGSSSGYGGYSAYAPIHAAAPAVASFAPHAATAVGCPTANEQASPLECMNRNARKPSKANHGARPCSSYNRKSSSPEFGSWRHPGLRPGQTPPPRPQPGTPMTIATVGVGAPAKTQQTATKQTVKQA